MGKVKDIIKSIPLIYNIYQNMKKGWINNKISQYIMMNKVLKYNKKRFIKYSGVFHPSKIRDMAYLTWLYHVIEKGLAMPKMRLGFGQDKVKELLSLILLYEDRYGKDNVTYNTAVGVLKEYDRIHKEKNYILPKEITDSLEKICKENIDIQMNNEYTRTKFFKYKNSNFFQFATSRHSVRNYDTNIDIEIEDLIKAIQLAQTAPSACNRQAARVHIVSEHQLIKKCLKLQNGNRGFGHLANKLLIITGNLQTLLGSQEFFDLNTNVGIFIMNLSYALHYYEIVHCILNWYVLPKDDIHLRKILNIPQEENIIAFITCGKAPKDFKIAISPKLNTEEIIRIH